MSREPERSSASATALGARALERGLHRRAPGEALLGEALHVRVALGSVARVAASPSARRPAARFQPGLRLDVVAQSAGCRRADGRAAPQRPGPTARAAASARRHAGAVSADLVPEDVQLMLRDDRRDARAARQTANPMDDHWPRPGVAARRDPPRPGTPLPGRRSGGLNDLRQLTSRRRERHSRTAQSASPEARWPRGPVTNQAAKRSRMRAPLYR